MVDMAQTAAALDYTPIENTRRTHAARTSHGLAHAAAAMATASSERHAILTRTIELDVIPRLLRGHGLGRAAATAPAIARGDVSHLVDLTLAADEAAASSMVLGFQDRGVETEALYLGLLGPAAECLGDMWKQDLCDFAEVTIGLARLHRAMRDLSSSVVGTGFLHGLTRRAGKRILLLPIPGEQHTFGISMVLEFFRRAGWNAWTGPVTDQDDLLTMVRADWVDVVGFSLACDERLETARTHIQAVRLASRNPAVAIMVGGPAFVANPELAAAIGADGTARDGRQAVREAGVLVTRHAAQHAAQR